MTISSSMNAGVAGLNVHASKLGVISDNIANSATNGYKKAKAEFSSLVRSESAGAYTAGGVSVGTYRDVESRGSLISTANSTDLSIAGRGMLPVTSISAVQSGEDDLPLMLVSTGSFEQDKNGVMRTQSGLVLMGWPANADGTIPPLPRDSIVGLEPVTIDPNKLAAEATRNMSFGANLPALETVAGASGDPVIATIEYYGNLGSSETLTATFTPDVPASGQSNTWLLEISDSASTTNPVAHYDIVFDASATTAGSILSAGVANTNTPLNGETYDPITGIATINVGGGPININIGIPGEGNQLTQYASSFAPMGITKDGAPVGTLASIEVSENGIMRGIYDSGFSRTLYQIPVADVPNLNGLNARDNQAFALSSTSGALYLWDAGTGPTGGVLGYSLEESSTDIAAELTSLIQTQRAYSSNAKIIQTVDEMLQETTNIKR